MLLFLESIAMGLIMAIPIGPNGVLCIRRTLKAGWMAGFANGLGVGIVDAIFGAIAGSGSSLIKDQVHRWEQWLRFGGSLVLIGYAYSIWKSKPPKANGGDENGRDIMSLAAYFFSGFILAISNPMVIFSFAAVYLGLGLESQISGNYLHLLYFVCGLGLGSCLWFGILCAIVARLRDKFSDHTLKRLNQICALLIVVFALYTLTTWTVNVLKT